MEKMAAALNAGSHLNYLMNKEIFEKLSQLSKEELGKMISQYREENKLTKGDLCKMLEIKPFTLFRWERAKVRISNAMIKILIYKGVLK